MSNSLLSFSMILAKSMFMAANAERGPYGITLIPAFGMTDLTKRLDDFAEDVLRPALNAALQDKGPISDEIWEAEGPDDVCRDWRGMQGRLRLRYDINNDRILTVIDVRVPAHDPFSEEQTP
jgi:hypothetical protein